MARFEQLHPDTAADHTADGAAPADDASDAL
jgi:hypothetical protein